MKSLQKSLRLVVQGVALPDLIVQFDVSEFVNFDSVESYD
jgi:hypothetical protein